MYNQNGRKSLRERTIPVDLDGSPKNLRFDRKRMENTLGGTSMI